MPRPIRYRGKKRLASVLAAIGITVLVVSVLSGTAYLFLRDYVSLTDDGILLSFPFWNTGFNRAPPSVTPSPPDDGDITVVVVDSPTPPPPVSPPVQESPVPAPAELKAVFLPQSGLGDTELIEKIAALCETDIDTVIIEIKSPDGEIASKRPELGNAVATLSGKARVVAYMSVLEDNSITRQRADFGIKHSSGVNWLDLNKSRWINPYVPEAREWLARQAAEAAVRFDALLLDRLWFPVEGLQTAIEWGQYADEPREAALNALLDEILAEVSVPCWAVIEPGALSGGNEYAGQDLRYLWEACALLVVRADDGITIDSITLSDDRVIPVVQWRGISAEDSAL